LLKLLIAIFGLSFSWGHSVSKFKKQFPEGEYQLLNRTAYLENCPASGVFHWVKLGPKDWNFEMSIHHSMRFQEGRFTGKPIKVDPGPQKGPCAHYKVYNVAKQGAMVSVKSVYQCQQKKGRSAIEGNAKNLVSSSQLVRTPKGIKFSMYEQQGRKSKLLYRCNYHLKKKK